MKGMEKATELLPLDVLPEARKSKDKLQGRCSQVSKAASGLVLDPEVCIKGNRGDRMAHRHLAQLSRKVKVSKVLLLVLVT